MYLKENATASALAARIKKLEGQTELAEQLHTFNDILRKFKLKIKPAAVRQAFLLKAETLEEARAVQSSKRTIEKGIASTKKTRIKKRKEQLAKNFGGVQRILKNRWELRKRNDALAMVFGKCALRQVAEERLFYCNLHLQSKPAEVVCAQADGKFSACPEGWAQSFELLLVLDNCSLRTTVTFAIALLAGASAEDYKGFFEKARAMNCLKPPFLICDFESAIAVSVRKVWPNIKVQGCYFHFRRHLDSRLRKIARLYGKPVSNGVPNLLAVSPFLDNLFAHLWLPVARLELRG